MSETLSRPTRRVQLELPEKLGFLLEPHQFKVAYGGRNSLKSASFAAALATLGIQRQERIICAREVQRSIADSVHQTIVDAINRIGYNDYYTIYDAEISCKKTGTTFRFTGLSPQAVRSAKSFAGVTKLWVEEADTVNKWTWQTVLPIVFRNPGSEVWVSFNPNLTSDETWLRFVENPPPKSVVVEMNYRDAIDCGWWTDEQELQRQYDRVHSPDDYDNIWEGKPRSVVAGAIYAREVTDMITEGRYRPIPYDPRLPVHRIWDLGWNDLMSVVMVQKPHPSALNIVNYIEDSRVTYATIVQTMDGLHYRWGDDWLPHDGTQHHPTSGTNAVKQLHGLTGRMPKQIARSDPEARIRAARMMFPRVYMDNTKRDTPPEYPDRQLGAGQLMERLKRYKRMINKRTGEAGIPDHNEDSHGADAWGGLAEIVDRIRNEADMPVVTMPGFHNPVPGMGMLA